MTTLVTSCPSGLKVGPASDERSQIGPMINARAVDKIERHVKVTVNVPAADRGELSAGIPDEGIPLLVDVGSSVGTTVDEGFVEARVADVVVGTARVERGTARLNLIFASQGTEAIVRLRYVPTSPWYEPLGESTIVVPIRGPGLLSKVPILVAGLGVLAFFQAIGLEPAWPLMIAVGLVETVGGTCVALGLLTRPAALAATVTTGMAAIYVHLPLGFYVEPGGVEFAGLWAIVLLYIAIRGGGAISLDRLIGREF